MKAARKFVLVTGGAGFIGSHLVDRLLEEGLSVRVVDNLSTGDTVRLNPRADLLTADIRDGDAVKLALKEVDCVFHVAALPQVPLSIEKPVETHLVNVV